MNKLLLSTFLLLVADLSLSGVNALNNGKPVSFTLSGCDSTFIDGEKIYLWSYHQNTKYEWIDSAEIRNNCFMVKGSLPNEHDVVYAYKGTGLNSAEQITGSFVVESGNLKFIPKGNMMFAVEGSPTNDSINSYKEKRTRYNAEQIAMNDGVMALWLLDMENAHLSKTEIEYVLDRLPQSYANHPSVSGWRDELSQVKTDIGLPYADITGTTVEGEQLSLSEIVNNHNNRYVLVDFGAAWCGPCRAFAKELTPVYDQLHAKGLEVFGVSYDASKSSWTNFINESGAKWPQITFGFGIAPRTTKAWKEYRLPGIPATFLIDCTTGIVIEKNLTIETLKSYLLQ